jgi:hypothetical protein
LKERVLMSEPESPARETEVLTPRGLNSLGPDRRDPDSRVLDPRDLDPRSPDQRVSDPRVSGPRGAERSPLSLPRLRNVGVNPPPEPGETRRVMPMPAPPRGPGRAAAAGDPPQRPTAMQRVIHGIRSALPLAQKVLPLLDGQILTAVSNLLAPHVAHPAPPADFTHLEGDLAEVRTRHIELYGKVIEQSAALRRVADRLEKVQETAERNAQDQQELKESVEAVDRKANRLTIVALCLLAVSIGANIFLFFHFHR